MYHRYTFQLLHTLGGNSVRYSSSMGQARAASTITWPSPVLSDSSTGTIAYATSHPTTSLSTSLSILPTSTCSVRTALLFVAADNKTMRFSSKKALPNPREGFFSAILKVFFLRNYEKYLYLLRASN